MTDPAKGASPPTSAGRKFLAYVSTTRFWLGQFLVVLVSAVFVVLAIAFVQVGGLPHDFDRYGIVGEPGTAVLELPAGRVMLDFVDDVPYCYDDTNHSKNPSIHLAPNGLAVRVVPIGGGRPLNFTSIPDSLYEGITGCRGHVPFGRIDVPSAGRYSVETTDSATGGFEGAFDTADPESGDSTSGPGIAFGAAPWTPLGSPLFGAVLLALLGIGLSLVPWYVAPPLWRKVRARLGR